MAGGDVKFAGLVLVSSGQANRDSLPGGSCGDGA